MRQVRSVLVAVVVLMLMPVQVWANGAVVRNNVSELRVKDVNGKRLGTVVGAESSQVTVALRINGRGVLLTVDAAQAFPVQVGFPAQAGTRLPIRAGNGDVLLYTSTDCSGTAMLASDPANLLPAATVAAPGMTVWVADTTATPQQLAHHSFLDAGLCRQQSANVVSPLVPAIPLVNLLDHFTPPFRVNFKR